MRDAAARERRRSPRASSSKYVAAAHVADHRGALDLRALVHEQLGQRADHLRRAGCRRRSSRRPRTRSSPSDLPAPEKPGDDHEVLRGSIAGGRRRRRRSSRRPSRLSAGLVQVGVELARRPSAARPGTASSSSRDGAEHAPRASRSASAARACAPGRCPGSSSRIDSVIALSRRLAVVRDREAVRLVAHALQQLQLGRVVRRARAASRRPGTKTSSIRLASETTVTPRSRKPCSALERRRRAGPCRRRSRPGSAARRSSRRGRRRAGELSAALALRAAPRRAPRAIAAKSSGCPRSSRIVKRR